MTIYVLCVPFKIIDKQHNNAMRILQSLRCYTGKVASPVDFICWDIHCKWNFTLKMVAAQLPPILV